MNVTLLQARVDRRLRSGLGRRCSWKPLQAFSRLFTACGSGRRSWQANTSLTHQVWLWQLRCYSHLIGTENSSSPGTSIFPNYSAIVPVLGVVSSQVQSPVDTCPELTTASLQLPNNILSRLTVGYLQQLASLSGIPSDIELCGALTPPSIFESLAGLSRLCSTLQDLGLTRTILACYFPNIPAQEHSPFLPRQSFPSSRPIAKISRYQIDKID